MSEQEKKEQELFQQDLDADELEGVSGGEALHSDNFIQEHMRKLVVNGVVNCAATVEKKSWCSSNDACNNRAVHYTFVSPCTYLDCLRPYEWE